MAEIEIKESIYQKNEQLAAGLNKELTGRGLFVINVMGAPGVGKTSSLMHMIPKLSARSFVIEGDIASDLDTKKLQSLNIPTVQINTGGACHLDTPCIADACESLPLENGVLWIENIGNLVCPAEFFIGEHVKMLIVSVTEGSDKPYKYPLAFEKADIILLNKCDLLAYVDFEEEFFMDGVRKLSKAPVIQVSGKTGEGFDEVVQWIENMRL